VQGAIDSHEIKMMPGYVNADGTPRRLIVRQWSGYIEVPVSANASSQSPSGSAFVHYWLVENSEKKHDAPTVIWQQGGPGGSSLIGYFTEIGPFTVNDESFKTSMYNTSQIPTVFDNPYSWHSLPANVLFVEHPAPTGFSYCVPVAACNWDDFNQSLTYYKFLVRFFQEYPELATNTFYMTGESYAGILIPMVAMQISMHVRDSNKHLAPWSLRGFALGNACPGNHVFTCTPYSGWRGVKVALDFRYGHGMIPEDLYRKIYQVCGSWWSDVPFPANSAMAYPPPEPCRALLEDPVRPCLSVAGDTYDMGGGYYLYDQCSADMLALNKEDNKPHPETIDIRAAYRGKSKYNSTASEYACGQEHASTVYLNLKTVHEAIHVRLQNKSRFDFFTQLQYNYTAFSLLDVYKQDLIPRYRILQYSGDADPCVPYVGTKRWIDFLDLPVYRPWHPWMVPGSGSVAGYKQIYAPSGVHHSFTYVTIRDAGHMSPRNKPAQAFHMIRDFIDGGDHSSAEAYI